MCTLSVVNKKPSSSSSSSPTSWNHSFTLTWLRKMCVDKLENVLVIFPICIKKSNKCNGSKRGWRLVITSRNWIFIWLHIKWMSLWKIEIFTFIFCYCRWDECRNRFSKDPKQKNCQKKEEEEFIHGIDFTRLLTNDFETESKTFSLTIQNRRASEKKTRAQIDLNKSLNYACWKCQLTCNYPCVHWKLLCIWGYEQQKIQ